jgi:hypothetical protein
MSSAVTFAGIDPDAVARSANHGGAMPELAQDLNYAFRVVRSRPVPSAVIIFTLALGIGINTMFFSF